MLSPAMSCEHATKFRNSHYDNDQIKVLETALELSWKELGIDDSDTENRDKLAVVMMRMASGNDFEPVSLKSAIVAKYRAQNRKRISLSAE